MPAHRFTSLEELDKLIPKLWPTNYSLPPLGASQLGYHIRDRSNRTGEPSRQVSRVRTTNSTMPAGKRTRQTVRRRAPSLKRRRTSTRRRSRKISDIHTFKGIINAGILQGIPSSTSTHLGGQYIFHLADFPIIGSGVNLGEAFDFVRLNKCRMEFMPRYNMSTAPNTAAGGTQGQSVTFLTGLDELPLVFATGTFTHAPTWVSQNDEDAGVTEATAYDHPSITPDYLRGMQNSKEKEIYKKHSVTFTPVFYDYMVAATSGNQTSSPTQTGGVFERRVKKWINLNYMSQVAGTEVASPGPDFYGPMYTFSNNIAGTSITQYYDVKLHYSVSFRRLRGI